MTRFVLHPLPPYLTRRTILACFGISRRRPATLTTSVYRALSKSILFVTFNTDSRVPCRPLMNESLCIHCNVVCSASRSPGKYLVAPGESIPTQSTVVIFETSLKRATRLRERKENPLGASDWRVTRQWNRRTIGAGERGGRFKLNRPGFRRDEIERIRRLPPSRFVADRRKTTTRSTKRSGLIQRARATPRL